MRKLARLLKFFLILIDSGLELLVVQIDSLGVLVRLAHLKFKFAGLSDDVSLRHVTELVLFSLK